MYISTNYIKKYINLTEILNSWAEFQISDKKYLENFFNNHLSFKKWTLYVLDIKINNIIYSDYRKNKAFKGTDDFIKFMKTQTEYINWEEYNYEDLFNKNIENSSYAIRIFQLGDLSCFFDWTYWISPSEYWNNWYNKIKNEKILNTESPYQYVNKHIKNLFWKNYEVFISSKEKFWQWVYERLYIHNKLIIEWKHNEKYLYTYQLKKDKKYYKLYFYIDQLLNKYIYEIEPFSNIENINQWKKQEFWIDI